MDRTALLIIDAQQEYFAPIGKVVLPDGPKAVARIAETLRWARESRMASLVGVDSAMAWERPRISARRSRSCTRAIQTSG